MQPIFTHTTIGTLLLSCGGLLFSVSVQAEETLWDKSRNAGGELWETTRDASGTAWEKAKQFGSDLWDGSKSEQAEPPAATTAPDSVHTETPPAQEQAKGLDDGSSDPSYLEQGKALGTQLWKATQEGAQRIGEKLER